MSGARALDDRPGSGDTLDAGTREAAGSPGGSRRQPRGKPPTAPGEAGTPRGSRERQKGYGAVSGVTPTSTVTQPWLPAGPVAAIRQ
jgi:hypothetical protein